ncbi:MAG: hypothetical protein OEY48_01290 [Gammaproteobacteria bacterium]|nr:hypothetical protein [Gammaproteobacteria bacterium]
MKPEQSRDFTERLEKAALSLLKMEVFRKPDDLARRFGLPLPVVRYWWRHSDQETEPVDVSTLSPKQAKTIRRATQTLEGWEKVKRYRPECGAALNNGKRCKNSVAIRPPEGWNRGCLADRCRMHGGLARRERKKKVNDDE